MKVDLEEREKILSVDNVTMEFRLVDDKVTTMKEFFIKIGRAHV